MQFEIASKTFQSEKKIFNRFKIETRITSIFFKRWKKLILGVKILICLKKLIE